VIALCVFVRSFYRTPYISYSDLRPAHVGGRSRINLRVYRPSSVAEVGGLRSRIPYPGNPYPVPVVLKDRRASNRTG
jgi:hypothetical protein